MSSLATHAFNPIHHQLAPRRTPKPRVVAPSSDIAKPSCLQITMASKVIEESGWVEMMEPLMPYAIRAAQGEHLGGRKPEMTVKALLTGCLMLAIMERPILIRDVWRLLAFGLDSASRKHLGLDPNRAITERMVSYTFGLIAAAVNPGVHSESNAALFDEEKMKAFLGLEESEELDAYEHAATIDEIL